MSDAQQPITVVGAGISGLAAARAIADRGGNVTVVDRGRAPGGRMSGRRLAGRPVDLGASYFTAREGTPFRAVVDDWLTRGLAREWTDTFAVATPDGIVDSTTGPMRHGAAAGLRSLVVDLGRGLEIRQEVAVDRVVAGEPTVLAMPDPQARRLVDESSPLQDRLDDGSAWDPTLAIALRFEERAWSADLHGVFVNDSPDIGFIADDGDRRGDAAPVLVVHSSPETARAHLDDPSAALPLVWEATRRVLGLSVEPIETHVHRWTFAKPRDPHDDPYLLDVDLGVGVCGDGWGGRSSVGAAWASGHSLGEAFPLP